MKPLIYYRIKGLFKNIGKEWDKLSPEKEDAIEFAHKFINPEPIKNVDTFTYSWEYAPLSRRHRRRRSSPGRHSLHLQYQKHGY